MRFDSPVLDFLAVVVLNVVLDGEVLVLEAGDVLALLGLPLALGVGGGRGRGEAGGLAGVDAGGDKGILGDGGDGDGEIRRVRLGKLGRRRARGESSLSRSSNQEGGELSLGDDGGLGVRPAGVALVVL